MVQPRTERMKNELFFNAPRRFEPGELIHAIIQTVCVPMCRYFYAFKVPEVSFFVKILVELHVSIDMNEKNYLYMRVNSQ